MNNEIKEILGYFNKYVNDKYETYTVVDDNTKYLKILLDYITNLQEEKKKREEHIYNLLWKQTLLEDRIDKAIEYIKYLNPAHYSDKDENNLLNILNGGDDNGND